VRSAGGRTGTGSARRLAAAATLVALLVALTAAGCGSTTPQATATAGAEGSPATLASPVTGVVVKIDSQGLTKVRGFTLRTDSGEEIPFTIGTLENGADFPPGHLAEHMSTSSRVRVFFRDEAGTLVVYRIEDAV
jgi:hypothetical protein